MVQIKITVKKLLKKQSKQIVTLRKKLMNKLKKIELKKKTKIKQMTKLKNQMKTLTKTVIQATQIILLKIAQTKVIQIQTQMQIAMKIAKATKIKTVTIA
ncbi:hypothetical protein DD607_28430 [Salmonella sp. 3DZ2-4SM]|nr:hypothetical protein DD607_28430 [Salmonella sp. 3DZ2-4SM]